MKKQMRLWLLALMVPAMGMVLHSCGDDDDEPEQMPSFNIMSSQEMSASGGTIECKVLNFNQSVSVRSAVSWIETSYDYRNGDCTLIVLGNNTGETRKGDVELRYKGETVDYLTVTQKADKGGNGGDNPSQPGEFGVPTGLSLSKNGCSVTLSWNSVAGATRYDIYYSNPIAFDSGTFVTMHSTSSTTYTMECRIAGNWAFKIMAFDGKNYSDYSNTVETRISESDINGGGGGDEPGGKPARPTGLNARVDGSQVYVSWNESKGASYYRLYYVKPAPYDIESFDNVYSTSTTMNCTVTGTWTIWVVAVGSDYEASEPSSKVTFNVTSSGGGGGGGGGSDTPSQLDTPTGLTVNSRASDPYVQLQCNGVTLGYDYQLYRSTSPNSGYSRINASVGSNASGSIVYFTDSNPLSGTSYYKVKVAALSSLGIRDSDFSDYIKVVR